MAQWKDDEAARSQRLLELLAPIHDAARRAARRFCRSNADGDDLFHEAVLKAFDGLDDLKDLSRFRPWFFAVMLNVHRARNRRAFWRRFVPFDDATREPAREAEAETFGGAQRMARALASLSSGAREAIVLFELEGFSLEEIAEMQSSSTSAVKSRLARAREWLCRHYVREGEGPRATKTTNEETSHGTG